MFPGREPEELHQAPYPWESESVMLSRGSKKLGMLLAALGAVTLIALPLGAVAGPPWACLGYAAGVGLLCLGIITWAVSLVAERDSKDVWKLDIHDDPKEFFTLKRSIKAWCQQRGVHMRELEKLAALRDAFVRDEFEYAIYWKDWEVRIRGELVDPDATLAGRCSQLVIDDINMGNQGHAKNLAERLRLYGKLR